MNNEGMNNEGMNNEGMNNEGIKELVSAQNTVVTNSISHSFTITCPDLRYGTSYGKMTPRHCVLREYKNWR